MIARATLVIAFASMVVACSDGAPSPAGSTADAPSNAPRGRAPSAQGSTSGERVEALQHPVAYDVLDRVDKVRDPFRQEVVAPVCEPGDACDARRRGEVAFGDVEVGSLRVRGTASAGGAGHAIVADASGRTRVVMPGARIGLPSRDGNGTLTEWSVDRVRNGDVILHEVEAGLPTGKTYVLRGSS